MIDGFLKLTVDERIEYARELLLPAELARLSHDEDVNVVIEVLRNPYVPFETMLRCSSSPDSRIRSVVAECPYPTILRELARDRCFNVAICVASNAKTPASTLDILSLDPSWQIRYAVSGNPSTFNDTLSYLVRDENYEVRRNALQKLRARINSF